MAIRWTEEQEAILGHSSETNARVPDLNPVNIALDIQIRPDQRYRQNAQFWG